MTRHYHDIGGGADLVLPRRRRAAALLSLWLTKTYVTRSSSKPGLYRVRELRHDRDEREQRDSGREHGKAELRVAVQLPRLGSDVSPQAVLSLRLRPGDDACVCVDLSPSTSGARVAVKRYKH